MLYLPFCNPIHNCLWSFFCISLMTWLLCFKASASFIQAIKWASITSLEWQCRRSFSGKFYKEKWQIKKNKCITYLVWWRINDNFKQAYISATEAHWNLLLTEECNNHSLTLLTRNRLQWKRFRKNKSSTFCKTRILTCFQADIQFSDNKTGENDEK